MIVRVETNRRLTREEILAFAEAATLSPRQAAWDAARQSVTAALFECYKEAFQPKEPK